MGDCDIDCGDCGDCGDCDCGSCDCCDDCDCSCGDCCGDGGCMESCAGACHDCCEGIRNCLCCECLHQGGSEHSVCHGVFCWCDLTECCESSSSHRRRHKEQRVVIVSSDQQGSSQQQQQLPQTSQPQATHTYLGAETPLIQPTQTDPLLTCRTCMRSENVEQMLRCCNCNDVHHDFCLNPALTRLTPGGADWACPKCAPTLPCMASAPPSYEEAVTTKNT